MLFLTNPSRRRRKVTGRKRRKARLKKGSAAAKRYMASIRPSRTRKRRKTRRAHSAPRVIVVRANKGGSMARKRRSTRRRRRSVRRHVLHANPRKRSRRHYRRNPSAGGITGIVMGGIKDGLLVTAGSAVTSAVPKFIPGGAQPGVMGSVIQLVTATAAGFAGHKFLGQNAGRMITAGGFSRVITTALIAANLPVVSAALSGNEDVAMLQGYPGNPEVSGYLQVPGVYSTGGLSPVSQAGLGASPSGGQYQDDLSYGIY